jgi:hypothetical protein
VHPLTPVGFLRLIWAKSNSNEYTKAIEVINDCYRKMLMIGKSKKVFRLPNDNATRSAKIKHAIQRNRITEDALYVRVTLEDGHFIWSSPIYLLND